MNVEKSNLAQRKGQTYLPKKLPHVIFYPASNRELWASLFVYVKFKSIFLYRQTGIYNKRKKRRLSAKERTDLSSPNACARDFVLIFLSQASTLSLRGPEIGFTQHDRLRSCNLIISHIFITISQYLLTISLPFFNSSTTPKHFLYLFEL